MHVADEAPSSLGDAPVGPGDAPGGLDDAPGGLGDAPWMVAMDRVLAALAFAAERHRGQLRKGVTHEPYINHPIGVVTLLWEIGGVRDVTTLVAALLHDVVEDTATTPEEVARRFGVEVAGIVAELTDDKSLPKATRKRLQIEHAPNASPPAKLVKLSDKIHNVKEIGSAPPAGWSLDRRQAYLDWARAVVAGLRGINPALEAAFDEALAAAQAAITVRT